MIVNVGVGIDAGMKFTSDKNGYVQGVRFYKASTDNGTHVGSLWTSSGRLLAQAKFTGETSSGWQQVNFGAPVAITANTIYVVSYHSTFYSYGARYFSAPVDNPPLHAVLDSVSPNGVYTWAGNSTFPNVEAGGANFWVDVAFSTATNSASLTSIAINPANATIGVGTTQQFQAIGTYSDSSTRDITGQVSWTSSTPAVATITAAGLATGVSAGTSQVTASLGTVTGSTALAVGSGPPPASNAYSVFSSTAVPVTANMNAGAPLELGMKFIADRDGHVGGVRFYKGSNNVGTHVGSLWSSTGQLLAQAVFVNETASGWQQVNFASPVAISANTVYVVSYHSSGYYSFDSGYFSGSTLNNPPLHGVWNALSPNGVFAFGATSTFPYAGAVGENFWVDVLFY